jgi:hypothetical protein
MRRGTEGELRGSNLSRGIDLAGRENDECNFIVWLPFWPRGSPKRGHGALWKEGELLDIWKEGTIIES